MKLFKGLIAVLAICTLAIGVCSCGQKINASEIRKYSDDIAENMLATIEKEDYNGHIKDFSDAMKKATTEDAFNKLCSNIKSKVGDYVSKQFMTVQSKDGYVAVIYKAKFTKDSNVIVRVVFKQNDASHLVQGEYYSSQKMAGK